jgi:predicted TIM-barrel fold metal-dependent hydrolase
MLIGAEKAASGLPIPTRMITNGEFMPIAQTDQQKALEHQIETLGAANAKRNGVDRRAFLASAAGMTTAFVALNHVFGDFFSVSEAEAHDMHTALTRRQRLAQQMIIDVQLHFIRDDYAWNGVLALGEYAKQWNPVLEREGVTLDRFKFENFMKEVYFDSDTKLGLISAAPADHGDNVILNNDGLAEARRIFNRAAGSRRMLCHSVIAPGQPGWLDEIERAIEVHRPDGWKGYTLGDPFESSQYPWRLDDEELMYPTYERMVRSGIRTVCIHKGLLPDNYTNVFRDWQHAMVDDVGKAAKDWPAINFVIYHSGFRPLVTSPQPLLDEFDRSGQIDWVTDLAAIPRQYGVSNVYAELGTTFGSCAVTHPRLAAAILGQLIQGMGADHVVWGTDSVWYGSPQWQIEAMRRIEIPHAMRRRHGFAALGPADGPVKQAIFSGNAARLFNLDWAMAADAPWRNDSLSAAKAEYHAGGAPPSNTFYGFVRSVREGS